MTGWRQDGFQSKGRQPAEGAALWDAQKVVRLVQGTRVIFYIKGFVKGGVATTPTSQKINISPMGVAWKEWTKRFNYNPNNFGKVRPLVQGRALEFVKWITTFMGAQDTLYQKTFFKDLAHYFLEGPKFILISLRKKIKIKYRRDQGVHRKDNDPLRCATGLV